jgi:hypothetical protein
MRTDRWNTNGPPPKNHVNWVILDSDWEAEFCRVVEGHPQVVAYTKNHNLGFEVPYRSGSESRRYRPDFIVFVDDGRGKEDPLRRRCSNCATTRRSHTACVRPGPLAMATASRRAISSSCSSRRRGSSSCLMRTVLARSPNVAESATCAVGRPRRNNVHSRSQWPSVLEVPSARTKSCPCWDKAEWARSIVRATRSSIATSR